MSVITTGLKRRDGTKIDPLTEDTQRLVETNRALAHYIQKRDWPGLSRVMPLEDLDGYLMTFLCEAASRFDANRGNEFGAFLGAHLWQRCGSLWREMTGVEIQRQLSDEMDAINAQHDSNLDECDSQKDVERYLSLVSNARCRKFICERFGIGCDATSYPALGRRHGMTAERARQIVDKGLSEIRRRSVNKKGRHTDDAA